MSDAGVVIVGAGQAGATVATGLAQAGYSGPITLIGDEPYAPYQRPPLSKGFLNGKDGIDALWLKPQAYYAQKNIHLITSQQVQAIQRNEGVVQLDNGEQIEYASLVLCTGSRPRALPVEGAELNNVFSLRGIDDARAIADALPQQGRLVIIGAGYIGLELAASCVAMGLQVTVLEQADRVMARSASSAVSNYYRSLHEYAGIHIITDVSVVELQGDDYVRKVHAADGRYWFADLVVVGAGAIPNTELAQSAGLACNDGILVDGRCNTSDPNIYAAGDCARQDHTLLQQSLRLESVQNATAQARMIVAHLTNKPAPRAEVPWFWSDQFDTRLQIAGIVQPEYRQVLRGDPDSGSFAVLHIQNDRLQAIEAINRPMDFTLGKRLINEQLKVNETGLTDEDTPLYPQPALVKRA